MIDIFITSLAEVLERHFECTVSFEEINDLVNSALKAVNAQHTVIFEDDSQLIVMASTGQAQGVFFRQGMRMVEAVHCDLLHRIGICCPELKANLAKANLGKHHDRYPRLAYISPFEYESGRRKAGWYQGASGPGYYEIWDISGKKETTPVGEVNDTVYLPLEYCPFCHTFLNEDKNNDE